MLGVAIVGCGLIGQKRAKALGDSRLIACADLQIERAQALARTYDAAASADWQEVIQRPNVDIVIVATTNHMLAEITHASVQAGKHVLVEKPAARTASELEPVIEAARTANRCVHVGFNHRYHPALRKAREIFDSGEVGELMFMRGR
jgi:predicted dehydrogenase